MGDAQRCAWADGDAAMAAYRDAEWGVPIVDDRGLFECLTLEAAQAGLSWAQVLARREGYRAVFFDWDLGRNGALGDADLERLRGDGRIIRHRQKIEATRANARAVQALAFRRQVLVGDDPRTFAEVAWSYAEPAREAGEVPAQTAGSRALSRELKSLGFRFVGPTIVYAFMQAAGIVNDHSAGCFRRGEVEALRAPLIAAGG